MSGLGRLASTLSLPVQTHLAENRPECGWVRELEPDCPHYTEVYRRSGLLGPRTILAHCCFLSQEEVELIREEGAGVSHCPNSNFSLKSGVCDVRRLQRAGVKVRDGPDMTDLVNIYIRGRPRHRLLWRLLPLSVEQYEDVRDGLQHSHLL